MNLQIDILGPLIEWLVGLMRVIGAPGAGIAIALENIFPPVPSEVILPAAGFAASRGHFTVASAIIWCTIGSTVGALALYWLGRKLGTHRLRRAFERAPLLRGTDVDRTSNWFARHGGKAVFFGRMIPMFRSLISIPAGVEHMPILRFVAFTTAGSAIWNSILILAGWYLGNQWHVVERYTGLLQNVLLVGLLVVTVWFIAHRVRGLRAAG